MTLRNVNFTVLTNSPGSVSVLEHFSIVDKQWLVDTWNDLNLCLKVIFDQYGAVMPFSQTTMIPKCP